MKDLRDIQSERDIRNIPIDQVGVKNISYPVNVRDRANKEQHTVAKVNMFVDLPHDFRGTHMSRFIAILNHYRDAIATSNIKNILGVMKRKLNAERAYFEIEFPYFIMKKAPVSKEESKMEYICRIIADSSVDYYDLSVRVPVLSVCPCSKEISSYGAHNQRSIVTVAVKAKEIVWIEELVEIAEKSASSDIYSLLKREDEKYITEKSYDNPMFAEDIVRNASTRLKDDPRIIGFSVESENMESIHNHSAYARIEKNYLQVSL